MEVRQLGPGFFAQVRRAGIAEVVECDDAYACVRAAGAADGLLITRTPLELQHERDVDAAHVARRHDRAVENLRGVDRKREASR